MNRNRINLVFFILIVSLFACSNNGILRFSDKVEGIELHTKMQFAKQVNGSDSLVDVKVMNRIYKLQDFIVFEVPIIKDVSHVTMNKSGDVIKEVELPTDTVLRYFVYQKDKKKGIMVDSLTYIRKKKFDVDSLLKVFNYNVVTLQEDQVLDIQKSFKSTTVEYYKPKMKLVDAADSIIFEFDKRYNKITYFSFSHKLDTSKKGKLIQCKYVVNKTIKNLRREVEMKMNIIKVNKQEEIKDLIAGLKGDL